jgi:F-type H+-transporting ATPase subunit epsilon
MHKPPSMKLEILTPEKRLYAGDVYGVQLPGIAGSFEVLERHAPLVSALGKGTIKVLLDRNGQDTARFDVSGGFIEVLDNRVSVLVEGASQV